MQFYSRLTYYTFDITLIILLIINICSPTAAAFTTFSVNLYCGPPPHSVIRGCSLDIDRDTPRHTPHAHGDSKLY